MLKLNKSQLKLQDCLTKYLNLRRSSSLSYFYRKEVERVFSQFCQFIEKTYIEDITFSDLQEYNSEIYRLAENCPLRPDLFILKRFTGLRAIFKAIVKKEENKEALLKLIANLQVFDYPRKQKTQPTCITKEQFQDIYKNYSGLTRLMLLLGTNAGYTSIDIVSLTKDMINLEQKTITRLRHKTNVMQVCYLWDETVQELKNYMEQNPNKTDYVFISLRGTPFNEQTLSADYWHDMGINVKHKWLRSSARTTATIANCNSDLIKALMGHTNGISDFYYAKQAVHTKSVVEAIYKYFFN